MRLSIKPLGVTRLRPFTCVMRDQTHRGAYHFARYTREDAWHVYFHEFHTELCQLLGGMAPYEDTLLAAQQHADRQPAYPFLAGWPALAEVLS